jgi:hypothetical protein
MTQKLRKERYAVKKPTKKKVRESAIIRETYRGLNNKVYF